MSRVKQLTATSLVEEWLRGRDDFATIPQIAEALGESRNRVSAAVHHLRNARVLDVIIEPSGAGWWFTRPTADDQRSRKILERTPETTPRRPRRPRKLQERAA